MNLDGLLDLKADPSVAAQMEYVDRLLTDVVQLCRRPGDVERVANTIDHLLNLIAHHRAHEWDHQ